MSRSLLFLAISLAFALVLAGASQRARKQNSNAKFLYENKCAKCHRLYEPRDYSEEEWRLWMMKMAKKAKLTSYQEKLLNTFLDAYRQDKRSNAEAGAQN